MKKTFLSALLVSCMALSAPAFAQFNAKGGFKDPAAMVNTVAEVKQMNDDSYVVLQGKIEKRIKNEHYLFSDSTSSIEIEIDNDDWHGLEVGPQDTVEIRGELDKGLFSEDIDVKSISLIKK